MATFKLEVNFCDQMRRISEDKRLVKIYILYTEIKYCMSGRYTSTYKTKNFELKKRHFLHSYEAFIGNGTQDIGNKKKKKKLFALHRNSTE